jgi:tRNA (cytidine/uridine-2'-O-)-methyltransferase
MRIALYEPDQAGNVGTILRLAACLGVPVDIVEPCGFAFSDRAVRRAGMDYTELVAVTRHTGWAAFERQLGSRLVLLTTAASERIDDAIFRPDDTILLGSESRGVPAGVHDRADSRLRIPQVPGTRSLNIAVAAGIALAEALRQTNGWPNDRT